MRFEELRLRAFMSFGEKEQVVKLANRGLVLIEGENKDDPTTDSNGSGKSAIFEALLWVVFGKTVRGYEADRVVNRTLGEGCCCKLTFSDDNGKAFRIERYRKDKKEKNRLRFFAADAELTCSDSSATQEAINTVLGMTYDTFVNSVVFGQGVIKHFAQMTDKEQKVIMDRLIGVERLVHAHAEAKKSLQDLDDEIAELDEEGAVARVESAKSALSQTKQDVAEWDQGHLQRIERLDRDIRKSTPTNTATDKLDELIRKAEDRQAEAVKELAVANINRAESNAKRDNALVAVEHKRKALTKVNNKGGRCPACGTVVLAENLESHRAELAQDLEDAEAERKKASEKAVSDSEYYRNCSDIVQKLNTEYDKLRQSQKELQSDKKVAERMLKERDSLLAEVNPHHARLDKNKKSLEVYEVDRINAQKKTAKLRKERAHVEFVFNMLSDKGSKNYPPLKGCLLDNVAPFLNEQANKYSNFITGGNIEISFETQRELQSGELKEEFSIKTLNLYGSDDYEGSSGGEKKKIDVCVALALQSLGASRSASSINIAFYDEIFESLDEAAVDRVMELLLAEAKTKDALFVITHLATLKAHFPKRIRVVKKNGCSSLS